MHARIHYTIYIISLYTSIYVFAEAYYDGDLKVTGGRGEVSLSGLKI